MQSKADSAGLNGTPPISRGTQGFFPDLRAQDEVPTHAIKDGGLRQAFEEKNIPLITQLFNASAKLYVDDFPSAVPDVDPQTNSYHVLGRVDKKALWLNNHGYNDAIIDWECFEQFVVNCCAFENKTLVAELFKRPLYQSTCGVATNSSIILNLVSCYASEYTLRLLFKTLGNELLTIGRLQDCHLKNFITILYDFRIMGMKQEDRLPLVLNALRDALGAEALSQFLVFQSGITPCGFWKFSEDWDASKLEALQRPTYLCFQGTLNYYDNISKSILSLRYDSKIDQLFPENVYIEHLSKSQLESISLITNRKPYDNFISSCIHEAVFHEQYSSFVVLVDYVLKEDIKILLTPGRKDIPLFWLLFFGNYEHIACAVKSLGDLAAHCLIETGDGLCVLSHIFQKRVTPKEQGVLELIMTNISATVPEFLSKWGALMLRGLLEILKDDPQTLVNVLNFFKTHRSWNIVEQFYDSERRSEVEYNKVTQGVLEQFNIEYYSSATWTCSIS